MCMRLLPGEVATFCAQNDESTARAMAAALDATYKVLGSVLISDEELAANTVKEAQESLSIRIRRAMIAIKGIRIESLTITRADDGKADEITAQYALISTADKVLAKQSVGGYDGVKLQPSPATVKAFADALAAYKADLNIILGLETT